MRIRLCAATRDAEAVTYGRDGERENVCYAILQCRMVLPLLAMMMLRRARAQMLPLYALLRRQHAYNAEE